jgi:transmembrane protein TMEM260 (protein O-mannosyltransferase)
VGVAGDLGMMSQTVGWCGFGRRQWAVLIGGVVVCAAVVFPRVVWAPCRDDPGEFQLTAAVGGIGHPPGHAGLVTVMRLACVVSPLAPHITVSAVNALFAVATVAILLMLMLRTGVHVVAAVAACFLFLSDDQFWHAAITPEVYGTCFVLLAGCVWSFVSWLRSPGEGMGRFWIAVVLFAYLAVNRGPTVLLAAAFVASLWTHGPARRVFAAQLKRNVAIVLVIGAGAMLIMMASVWFRDVPGSRYNYLEITRSFFPDYTAGNVGFRDKWARMWWLISAKQYDYMFAPTLRTAVGQARWLLSELGWAYWPVMLVTGCVTAVGVRELRRRNRPMAVLFLAMIPASVLPILLIRVVSNTAMIPNLLFPLMVFFGHGLTRVLSLSRSAVWMGSVIAVFGLTVWFVLSGPLFPREPRYDGWPLIRAIDLESLPEGATFLTDFDAVALVYYQYVLGHRRDVTVLHAHGRLNRSFVEGESGRVFSTIRPDSDAGLDSIGDGLVFEIVSQRGEHELGDDASMLEPESM